MTARPIVVNTIELDERTWHTTALVERIDAWRARLERVRESLAVQSDPRSGNLARTSTTARDIASELDELAHAFARASRIYDEHESVARALVERMSDVTWWLIGRLLPTIVVLYGPHLVVGSAASSIGQAFAQLLPRDMRVGLDRTRGRVLARIIANPATLRAIEVSIGSLDEGAMGALGIPLGLALIAGSAGAGVTSTAGAARLASRINGIVTRPDMALAESNGSGAIAKAGVIRVGSGTARAPADFAQLLERIPTDADAGAQVRIEQYDGTYVVYIGGTVDGSFGAGEQPWDMSSNIAALGGDAAASETAVREAMSAAGITSDTPVVLVGHSQGGLVAMRIAESPDVSPAAVITAGAPIHQISLNRNIPVVAFEHSDDLVPVLGGPVTVEGTTYVRRAALTNGREINGTNLLPAHDINAYVETARMTSLGADARLTDIRSVIDALTRDGTSSLWRGKRP